MHSLTKFPNPKQIHKLEYRLNDEKNGYPLLYIIHEIDKPQLFVRKNCEYFVLEGRIYEAISTAIEMDCFVIYVEPVIDEFPYPDAPTKRPLGIEVRLFVENGERHEIHFIDCFDHEDVMCHLDNTYFYFNKKEYERTSSEIDQDRRIYVLYVQPTGVELA